MTNNNILNFLIVELVGGLILTVLGGFLGANINLLYCLLALLVMLLFLKLHVSSSVKQKKWKSWLTGTLIVILGITSAFFFGKSNFFSSFSASNEDSSVTEENDEEPNDELAWFADNCIPSQWKVFNTEYEIIDGCYDLSSINMRGSSTNGFDFIHNADNPTSFLFYRPIEDVTEITFYILINNLEASPLLSGSTDFFFGFTNQDQKMFELQDLPNNDAEFDGEFIIFSGQDDRSIDGLIHFNENTYHYFDQADEDLEFKERSLFKVSITINGNMWNVDLVNVNIPSDKFSKSQLNTKNNIFVFGARVPLEGVVDLSVYDFLIE